MSTGPSDAAAPFAAYMALCEDGTTASGWACTGSAHVGAALVKCTDSSHGLNGSALMIDGVPIDVLPALSASDRVFPVSDTPLYDMSQIGQIADTTRWTCG